LDSDTRSINVFSLRKSMGSPSERAKEANLQQNSLTFRFVADFLSMFRHQAGTFSEREPLASPMDR
jgi:hypothetical protein